MSEQDRLSEHLEIDTLVIGAGVVGLAVARQLALSGREVWLLEKESEFGSHTSSRNSEVIHAGIYYPKGSLKAELCVRGKHLLYEYCRKNQIPFNQCGKIIVAKDETQIDQLKGIQKKAIENQVEDLVWLDRAELNSLEPDLAGLAGLLSPSTGTLDSHQYMIQLLADFEANGGQLVYLSDVRPTNFGDEGVTFEIAGQGAMITAKYCVNSAGLDAVSLFSVLEVYPKHTLPKARFAKGDYFSYGGRVPFKHLIYPVPEVGGLGVHLTLDQSGAAKFGPDVTWLKDGEDFDYRVDENKRVKFAEAIRSYWPELKEEKLVPDYAGIRPKISGPEDPAADFLIQGEVDHGVPGLINLFGIESPGLTASLAIAEYVESMLIP